MQSTYQYTIVTSFPWLWTSHLGLWFKPKMRVTWLIAETTFPYLELLIHLPLTSTVSHYSASVICFVSYIINLLAKVTRTSFHIPQRKPKRNEKHIMFSTRNQSLWPPLMITYQTLFHSKPRLTVSNFETYLSNKKMLSLIRLECYRFSHMLP